MKEKRMLQSIERDRTLIIFAITIVSITILFFASSVSKRIIMADNIDNAIEKGIDPITVRCAYAPATDNVCLAYAITHKPLEAPKAPTKKK
jgi:hypothetical protein